MLRNIKLVVLAIIMLAIVTLALANRDPVTLHVLPGGFRYLAPYDLEVPLFLVILVSIFAGLLIGYILEWLREHKHRRLAAEKQREASKLKQEVTTLKRKTMSEADELLSLVDKKPGNA